MIDPKVIRYARTANLAFKVAYKNCMVQCSMVLCETIPVEVLWSLLRKNQKNYKSHRTGFTSVCSNNRTSGPVTHD